MPSADTAVLPAEEVPAAVLAAPEPQAFSIRAAAAAAEPFSRVLLVIFFMINTPLSFLFLFCRGALPFCGSSVPYFFLGYDTQSLKILITLFS